MINKRKKAEKISKKDHETEVKQLKEKVAMLENENLLLRSAPTQAATTRESLAHPKFWE